MLYNLFNWKWPLKEKPERKVTFATACWEEDYHFLEDTAYLHKKIVNHTYLFSEKILVINNVKNVDTVKKLAEKRKEEGFFTEIIVARDHQMDILKFFHLEKASFISDRPDVSDDWVFYNGLAPLAAIYFLKTPYLLYTTGDVYLDQKINWIPKALTLMEKKTKYKVANLTWNDKYDEAKKESFTDREDFYVAKKGFSDQMFLVRKSDFKKPIYSEIRPDSHHFPRGTVFEKRVYSYMLNHHWQRLTYKKGSYQHHAFQRAGV